MKMHDLEVILPIGSVILLFALRIMELLARRDVVAGQKKETLTLRLFIASGIVLIVLAIAEFFWRKPQWSIWWFAAGWAIAIASITIRRKAIAALGKFWSLHVEIRSNHQFVRTGPFRWMRHPTYFSMLLESLAVVVLMQAWYTALLIPVMSLPMLLYRLRIEERALVEKFGDTYLEYQRTTPALFPVKWPTAH